MQLWLVNAGRKRRTWEKNFKVILKLVNKLELPFSSGFSSTVTTTFLKSMTKKAKLKTFH